MNMESALRDFLNHVLAQHQVLHVLARNNHTLLAGQALQLAGVKEAFNFGIHAANRLHLPQLIHRAGNRP